MSVIFKDTKNFNAGQLRDLFLSVGWSSGKYPEKLVAAMKNSSTVFSAWDNDKLIGLVNVLDDSVMTAYIHYLLVKPEYHSKGIGKELVNLVKAKYKDFLRISVIAYCKETGFYTKCGFIEGNDKTSMFITSLQT